jgi:hypothetical protein
LRADLTIHTPHIHTRTEKKKLAEGLENVEIAPITREEMEEQLDKELEDKMSEIDKKKRREKKKERQRKAKLRQRVALGMETPGDGGVQEQETDLFSAASIVRKDAADLILDQAPDDVLESPVDSEEGTLPPQRSLRPASCSRSPNFARLERSRLRLWRLDCRERVGRRGLRQVPGSSAGLDVHGLRGAHQEARTADREEAEVPHGRRSR